MASTPLRGEGRARRGTLTLTWVRGKSGAPSSGWRGASRVRAKGEGAALKEGSRLAVGAGVCVLENGGRAAGRHGCGLQGDDALEEACWGWVVRWGWGARCWEMPWACRRGGARRGIYFILVE